ncbi:CocE/NonD family hydrolase C-terminal non-catalytic domain-containing protein [Streptomyces sp. NPDC000994]
MASGSEGAARAFVQPLSGAYVSALGGEVPWLDEVMTHPDADDACRRGAGSGSGGGPDQRADQPDHRITVPLSATAHRFAAGHRIRRQLVAGAHPRCARNPGTGESPVDATFTPVRVTLHADSALTLAHGSGPA